jgi:hypothetical protein
MRPCARCRRHVRLSDRTCPFCGAGLVEETAPAVVGWAVGLAMLGAACGPGEPQGDTGGASTGAAGSSSGASVGTTSAGSETTGEPTTNAGGTTTGCPDSGCLDVGEGGAFIYGGSDPPPNGECDPWLQDCPDGEKCTPYSSDGDNSWDLLKCVPVMENPGAVGDPCTVEGSGVSGIDSCEKGAVCWSVDAETGEGNCVAQCTGTPDMPECAAEGTSCLNSNNGTLTLCLPTCDPLLQGCPDMDLCLPNPSETNSFICVVDASGDEGQEWDACEYVNACDAGLLCANPALATECDWQAAGCCLPFCDLSIVPTACKGVDQECLAWFEEGQAPPGFEDVGVCGIPQ